MVVVDALHGDSAAAVADDLFGGGGDLQAFLDHAAPDVKPSGGGGGDEGEEELEWLSNKDAFPTVETMAPSAPRRRRKGTPRPRWEVAWGPPQAPVAARAPAAGWRCRHCWTDRTPQWREGPEGRSTLCNACGVRYRSGRLVPEYRPLSSPTFSPELHSNWHRRVVELRRLREGAVNASLAAAGNGEKGNGKLERLLNKGEFLAVQMMAPAPARPRTEGMRRPRKAQWTGIAWSPPPPPPPQAPAVEGRLPSQGGGAGMAVEQGRVPDGDDDGLGGCAAVPVDGGLNPAAPLAPSAAAGWRCQKCGTEKTPQWHPEGRTTLCFDGHNRGKLHRLQELSAKSPAATAGGGEEGKEQLEWPSNMDAFPAVKATPPAGPRPQTKRVRRVVELSPPRAPPPPRRQAVAVEQGGVGDLGAAAAQGRATAAAGGGGDPAAARAATPRAPAVSGRQCRHCGAEKTPQWREGPEGRQTLCNACGVRYKSGRLVPEYRPAGSPTFSPGLHSNSHRQVLQLRSRRKEPAEVSPASAAVAMACAELVFCNLIENGIRA